MSGYIKDLYMGYIGSYKRYIKDLYMGYIRDIYCGH